MLFASLMSRTMDPTNLYINMNINLCSANGRNAFLNYMSATERFLEVAGSWSV